jgi:hypothetical protein
MHGNCGFPCGENGRRAACSPEFFCIVQSFCLLLAWHANGSRELPHRSSTNGQNPRSRMRKRKSCERSQSNPQGQTDHTQNHRRSLRVHGRILIITASRGCWPFTRSLASGGRRPARRNGGVATTDRATGAKRGAMDGANTAIRAPSERRRRGDESPRGRNPRPSHLLPLRAFFMAGRRTPQRCGLRWRPAGPVYVLPMTAT